MMNRRTRILSVIGDVQLGGDEHRLLSFARAVDRAAFEHFVITINGADPECEAMSAMRRQYAESGVRLLDLGEGPSKYAVPGAARKPVRLARRVGKLCRVIRKLDIDVVDAHRESAGLIGVLAAMMTGRPRLVTLYHPRPLTHKWFWMPAQQIILSGADIILTDSNVRGREIANASLLKNPRVVVIPNGVSPPEPGRAPGEMREALGLPKDPRTRVIGQISRLVEYKGHMVLLEAARSVLQNEPHAFFLFVGYTESGSGYRRQLERKAFQLGIAGRVRIVGYPGPIGDVWSVIDVHVHASLLDSLPNAIIEGMSLGKPAVVTAVGGVPDAVAQGRSGLVVPPGDAGLLARAILQFLRDPDLARACGAAAFARYEQNYQAGMTARKLESCFLKVVGAHE